MRRYPILFDLSADEIEQGIIRAYVRLVFQDEDTDNSRPVVLMRFGPHDVHVSETPPKDASSSLPQFWIQVFDGTIRASIDSIEFHGFDDAELAAAVEMILSVAGSQQSDDSAELRALVGRSECSSTDENAVGDKEANLSGTLSRQQSITRQVQCSCIGTWAVPIGAVTQST